MSMGDAEQKAEMRELDLWGSERHLRERRSMGASKPSVKTDQETVAGKVTMEAIVTRENMVLALRAVERNAGAAGVDGMTTKQLRGYLSKKWEDIGKGLLEGRYQPHPVKRVDISKAEWGTRMLGVMLL